MDGWDRGNGWMIATVWSYRVLWVRGARALTHIAAMLIYGIVLLRCKHVHEHAYTCARSRCSYSLITEAVKFIVCRSDPLLINMEANAILETPHTRHTLSLSYTHIHADTYLLLHYLLIIAHCKQERKSNTNYTI